MSRGKKLLILLAVVAVCAVAAVLVVILVPKSDLVDEGEDTGEPVLEISKDSVTKLSWSYDDVELSFEKDGESWKYAEDSAFPVDEEKIDEILDMLSSVSATKTVEDVTDYDQYGLTEPGMVINVSASSDYTINVGNESAMGDSYYTSFGDGNVYLVDMTDFDIYNQTLLSMVKTDEIPQAASYNGFSYEGEENSLNIIYKEDSGYAYTDEYVWFEDDNGSYTALDTDNTESLVSEVSSLSWDSCVNYNASDSDLEEYGLSEPKAVVTLDIATVYEEAETSEDAAEDESESETEEVENEEVSYNASFVLELGDTVEGSGTYARVQGSGIVCMIDEGIFTDLEAATLDTLLPDEIILLDINKVTQVDITLDGETYSVYRESVENEEYDPETDDESKQYTSAWSLESGEEFDIEAAMDSLFALTINGERQTLTPEEGVEIEFVFYQESADYPEVSLILYKYDSENCIVSLNGECNMYTLRSGVTAITEEIENLILDIGKEKESES